MQSTSSEVCSKSIAKQSKSVEATLLMTMGTLSWHDKSVLTLVSSDFPIVTFSCCSYTQCIPSRFKKDIVCAAAATTPAGLESSSIAFDDLHRVLHNIGADNRMADEELKAIIQEMGDANGQIPAKRFYQIL